MLLGQGALRNEAGWQLIQDLFIASSSQSKTKNGRCRYYRSTIEQRSSNAGHLNLLVTGTSDTHHLRIVREQNYTYDMRRALTAILAVLMLCWSASPLLACMIPGQTMTPQERDCCKHMSQMCGSAEMPQSHSCCKKDVQHDQAPVVKHEPQAAPALHVVDSVSTITCPMLSELLFQDKSYYPIPEFHPETTVLRI